MKAKKVDILSDVKIEKIILSLSPKVIKNGPVYLSPVSDRIDRHLHFETIFDTQRLEPREGRRSGLATYDSKSQTTKSGELCTQS